jgi:hypothetical protein
MNSNNLESNPGKKPYNKNHKIFTKKKYFKMGRGRCTFTDMERNPGYTR